MSHPVIYALFIVFFVYFLLQFFYYLFLLFIGSSLSPRRLFERREEEYEAIMDSYFMLPVSIIVPAHNEERWIEECVRSLLNLDYPEYEIIIVNDGSVDRTMALLHSLLALRPLDKAVAQRFRDGFIFEVFQSEKYPRVSVINKPSGHKKAGAVNAGLNIARYKYICAQDADTILEPNALRLVMAQVQKDPERIVGVGSYFGLLNGFTIKDGKIVERSFSYNPLIAYQNLEYIRSFIGNRMAWEVLRALPIVSGGFGIWRRDFITELEGYDSKYTCEDLAFTFRAQDYINKKKKDLRIISLPYYVGWTEGPSTIKSLLIQRNRWQRVTHEAVFDYRYVLFNPRYRWFGFVVYPYFLLYESLGVVFEVVSMGIVAAAWFKGLLHTGLFLSLIVFMSLSQTIVSLLTLMESVRYHRLFRLPYLLYLILLSFFELFLYRWINTVAKIQGTWGFVRGKRTYDQYVRTART